MNDDDEYHVLLYNIMYYTLYIQRNVLDKSRPLFFLITPDGVWNHVEFHLLNIENS